MDAQPEVKSPAPAASALPPLSTKAVASAWLGMLLPGLVAVAAIFALLTPLARIDNTPFIDGNHPIPRLTKFFATAAGLVGGPAGLVALVLGHMARREIHRSRGTVRGSRHALVGLIGGYLCVALLALSILIPVFVRAFRK
jgi:hypothetical protein